MALNYSHHPSFPGHIVEDNLDLPMRVVDGYIVEGVYEDNIDAFGGKLCMSCNYDECFDFGRGNVDWGYMSRNYEDCFDFGRGKVDWGCSSEIGSRDVIDLLPADPFGMDIGTTVTAITGWFEDLEADYRGFGRSCVGGAGKVDNGSFAGLRPIWNNAMKFNSITGTLKFDKIPIVGTSVAQHSEGRGGVDLFAHNSEGSCSDTSMIQVKEKTESSTCLSCGDDGTPHEAFFFALGYLGVKDLLSLDMVCRSLHSAVRSDSLLWRSIQFDRPLNERITDELLFQLCSKAQGYLQHLCLVECPKITVDGLRRVVESNAQLTKLCTPGCTKLSVDGIMSIVKDANSKRGSRGIKKLRIARVHGATYEHFKEVTLLLRSDNKLQETNRRPLFYKRFNSYLSCDDDRCLDIELCPMCHEPKMLYDCPAKECQEKNNCSQICRACIRCIERCVDCGSCINENAYEENFCLEVQCLYCFEDPLKLRDKQDDEVDMSNGGRSPNLCHNS